MINCRKLRNGDKYIVAKTFRCREFTIPAGSVVVKETPRRGELSRLRIWGLKVN